MTNNPLGRGLESLIPKSQQRKADDAQQPVRIFDDQNLPAQPVEPARFAEALRGEQIESAEEASKVFTRPPQDASVFGQVYPPENAPALGSDSQPQEISVFGQAHPSQDDSVFGQAFTPVNDTPILEEELPPPIEAPKPLKNPEPVFKPVLRVKKDSEPKKTGEAIYYIEVSKIHPNPDQPRKNFDEDALRELASSIREFGLLQPIVVSKIEKDTEFGTEVEYELIAGERRLMATKLLGMDTIPAIIRNMRLERERLELAIIENLQRENLNPLEMARAYARLQDEFRLTQREVASRLGKSRETVANTLRLLDLPTPIQESIEKGQLTESHGRLLLTIDDAALQEKLFRDLLANKLTTRELKIQATDYSHAKEELKAKADMPAEIKMAEERLASELGAPVAIRESRGTGRITISFYSKEELINLLKRLGAQEDDSLFP